VRDVLHANSYLFGALGSAIGAGMLAGGFAVTPLARRIQQKAHLITAGILLCGACIAAIAAIPNNIAALAGCVGIALLFAGDLASRLGIATVFYGSAAMLLLIAIAGTLRLRRIE
jgi:glucose-6-phosphate dehydrogenase assembly protein OpcA